MINRIEGTPYTQKMISTVIKDLRRIKPDSQHALTSYSLELKDEYKKFQLFTEEKGGIWRKTSIIEVIRKGLFSNIHGYIDNMTGQITVDIKPPFMPAESACDRIINCLQMLQPERRGPQHAVESAVKESKVYYTAGWGDEVETSQVSKYSDCKITIKTQNQNTHRWSVYLNDYSDLHDGDRLKKGKLIKIKILEFLLNLGTKS